MEADISIWRKTGHFYFALTNKIILYRRFIFPLKRISVFDVALCHRQEKYAPCDFPASFRLDSFLFCFPSRPALPAGSTPKYSLEHCPPAAYSKVNSVATRY